MAPNTTSPLASTISGSFSSPLLNSRLAGSIAHSHTVRRAGRGPAKSYTDAAISMIPSIEIPIWVIRIAVGVSENALSWTANSTVCS